jgi:hypothetical protein
MSAALLSIVGLETHTFFGIQQPPWDAFHSAIEMQLRMPAGQPPPGQDADKWIHAHEKLQAVFTAVDTPGWSYAYSAVLTVAVAVAAYLGVFASMTLTRLFIRKAAEISPTVVVADLIVASVLTLLVAFLLVSLLGFFFNPAIWVAVLLSKVVGVGWTLLMIVGADIFGVWIAGAWLKAILVTSLLPLLFLVNFGILSLVSHYSKKLRRWLDAHIRQFPESVLVPISIVMFSLLAMAAIVRLLV